MGSNYTREEAYWARMAGEPIETPEAQTRKEYYMQIAKQASVTYSMELRIH